MEKTPSTKKDSPEIEERIFFIDFDCLNQQMSIWELACKSNKNSQQKSLIFDDSHISQTIKIRPNFVQNFSTYTKVYTVFHQMR